MMVSQREEQLRKTMPPTWPGSLPEFLVYRALIKAGLVHGVDFMYQQAEMGGAMAAGGAVVDFVLLNPPDLAISVAGVYYHYERGSGIRARDAITRAQLESRGLRIVTIDEDDALRDADFYVREALRYRDHSRAASGV